MNPRARAAQLLSLARRNRWAYPHKQPRAARRLLRDAETALTFARTLRLYGAWTPLP